MCDGEFERVGFNWFHPGALRSSSQPSRRTRQHEHTTDGHDEEPRLVVRFLYVGDVIERRQEEEEENGDWVDLAISCCTQRGSDRFDSEHTSPTRH